MAYEFLTINQRASYIRLSEAFNSDDLCLALATMGFTGTNPAEYPAIAQAVKAFAELRYLQNNGSPVSANMNPLGYCEEYINSKPKNTIWLGCAAFTVAMKIRLKNMG